MEGISVTGSIELGHDPYLKSLFKGESACGIRTSLVKGTFNFKKRSSRRSLQSLQLVHSNLNYLQSLQSL
jgi:hypothetical protein